MNLWRSGVAACVLWSACAGVEREEQEQVGRIEELERELDFLREEKLGLEEQLVKLSFKGCVFIFPPKVDAHVLEVVPGYPLVMLDAGMEEGVGDGYIFSIYLGTAFKGQVKTVKVEEHRSLAVILNEKKPIAVGDSASTGI